MILGRISRWIRLFFDSWWSSRAVADPGSTEESFSNLSEYSCPVFTEVSQKPLTHNQEQSRGKEHRIVAAKTLYKFDWSVPDIAKELNVHPDTVYKYLRV